MHQQRLQRLQHSLPALDCQAVLIEDPIDLYYLTGLELSTGKLLVAADQAALIVDKRYFELCQQRSPVPVWEAETHPLNTCLTSPEFAVLKTLGFDGAKTSYKNYRQLEKQTVPHAIQLRPLDAPLQPLRAIKDPDEIQLLRDAASLGSLGFDFVLSLLKEGITEIEVADQLEIFWKKHGSKGLAFDPIIAFGANSSMPHYRAGRARLKKGDIVLVDIGVNLHHYHSDMTRTVFFGTPHPQLLAIHAIVQQAQRAALARCRPGITLGELDAAARELIAAQGFGPQFSHSLGHGVGLEIHEYPPVKNAPPYQNVPLAAGMVITIEPGIYLPQLGGVRIEDTVAITADGCEDLTKRPTDPLVI